MSCSVDDVKEQALEWCGPEGQLVRALRNKGYVIEGRWQEDKQGKVNINFSASFDWPVEWARLDLRLLGANVGLDLENLIINTGKEVCEWQATYKPRTK